MNDFHEGKIQTTDFRYFAFISYNSKDLIWGKRLQRKLEHYRMPATLCSERGWKRKPMNPVFFAPYEIQPGDLDEELKERLRSSKNLIVICSPNSAHSEWVGKEIEYFHSLGRGRNIHFFIVDGTPNSGDPETECFNPVVKSLGFPEILGANVHEKIFSWPWLNCERAYVQLISKLLGVEFDSIWKRHRRQLMAKTATWIAGTVTVAVALGMTWLGNQPFDTTINLDETSIHNPNLPPLQNAIVTIALDEETKTDTILREGGNIIFSNIPHKYLGKKVRITFSCPDFYPLDTLVSLAKDISLKISRNPMVYGNIQKKLWDWKNESGVPNTSVKIDQWETISDSDGIVRLTVPLELQQEFYLMGIPTWNIEDTVFMPCEDGQVIVLEK